MILIWTVVKISSEPSAPKFFLQIRFLKNKMKNWIKLNVGWVKKQKKCVANLFENDDSSVGEIVDGIFNDLF